MRRISVILTAFAITSAVMAQSLTLTQCREKALEHNKSLQSARAKEEKLSYDVKSYKANFFPKLDIYAGDLYNFGSTELALPIGGMAQNAAASLAPTLMQMGVSQQTLGTVSGLLGKLDDPTMSLKIKNTFTADVVLIQPLYMGGKITAAYDMAKLGHRMAGENVRLTEYEVIVSTDEAYMLAVKAKQLADVARKYKALLDELQKNVDAAVAHGLKMRNDAMKVQVKRNEVELNIVRAENAYRLACMNLCQVIGMELNAGISVDESSVGTFSAGNTDAMLLSQVGITSRPEYSILQDKTDMARRQVRLAKSDYLPQVALMGAYSYLNGMELEGRRMFDGGSPSVAVTVKVPVLEYFTQGVNKIRSARAAEQIAQLEQEELNEKMTLELTQCANMLSEAALEVEITRKSTEQAADNMNTSRHMYEVGTEPLSDYLEAQALWQQASANEIEARYQYFLANTKYMKAAGKLER